MSRTDATRKPTLHPNRRVRAAPYRETPDVADAVQRLVTALGRRVADGDPDELLLLRSLSETVRAAEATAVAGLRAQGHSDATVAGVLGCSRQAVEQRWPRPRPEGG